MVSVPLWFSLKPDRNILLFLWRWLSNSATTNFSRILIFNFHNCAMVQHRPTICSCIWIKLFFLSGGLITVKYAVDIDLLIIADISGKSSSISRANRSDDSKKLLQQPNCFLIIRIR